MQVRIRLQLAANGGNAQVRQGRTFLVAPLPGKVLADDEREFGLDLGTRIKPARRELVGDALHHRRNRDLATATAGHRRVRVAEHVRKHGTDVARVVAFALRDLRLA